MKRRRRRALYYLLGLVGVVFAYTLLYKWSMAVFEGESRTLLRSLVVVLETITTTGYGEDAPWTTVQIQVLMSVMMVTGVVSIFMALPLFVVPWIEDRVSTTVPTAVEREDHVVICSHTSRSQMLIDELTALDIPYVLVETDRELATELYERGLNVILGDPEATDALEAANVRAARAVVADVDDESNASILLAANQALDDGETMLITFAEDPDMAEYHYYAGADHVFSPRQLIGESLAHKVTTSVTADVGDAIEIDGDFEIAELPVQPGSDLAGVRVAESGIRERTGAQIIGAWFEGEFASPPSPDATIDARTVLLVAGHEDQLERLKELTLAERRDRRRGDVVVCGHGVVGSTITQNVTTAGMSVTTIDQREGPGVDVVGDVTDADTLSKAGVESAGSVILAIPDDTASVFATLVIRELAPNVEIVARADQTENVPKLYRAGADYVLSLATVSGRMLASTILEEDVISFDQQIEVVRIPVGVLAGESLASADIRARTGCTIIAIERDGDLLTEFDPDFRFQRGDEAIAVGPDERVTDFSNLVE
jgi:Trk K+ transport system NAD-binding subunit